MFVQTRCLLDWLIRCLRVDSWLCSELLLSFCWNYSEL